MIKITMWATDDIEDVSALAVENILRAQGVDVRGTNVKHITQKQFDKGMERHRGPK